MHDRMLRGIVVSEIGFGAAQLGNLYRATSDADARAAVDAAWDGGIRYFDTAPHYGVGLSERRLGEALRDRPREQFVVSTKVGRLLVPTPERAAAGLLDDDNGFAAPATHRREWDFSRDGILRSIEGSLERLGLGHIDIVYLHDPDEHGEAAFTTGVRALIELRDQGVVRAVGAGMNQAPMLTRFIEECDIDVVMVAGRHTLLDRTAQEELLPRARERGVAVVAAAVYNSGLLSMPTVPDDATYDYGPAPADVISRARRLAEVCARHGVTLPEAAVQYPLREETVASVVVGMRTAAQVESTLARYAAEIPEAAWRELESV
ncbi:aldo/keto reductase [Microbacterium sp. SORGH_AS_0888]|uniref:aldo/keto reductase n=1 Tax=Microbacterium sp. SORGH_AS_0888 TaxID=3041791 RepID=UPI00277FEF61|nr:aldo/keto reductase [Microbacterium sp. SORGH_AS_0888]MDQ1130301.1 D-threo-aldose 1-dehydrogenase [Microbacterium sp. SORGH_AS_0888]